MTRMRLVRVPQGTAYQRIHAATGIEPLNVPRRRQQQQPMGQEPTTVAPQAVRDSDIDDQWVKVPAIYTLSIMLGGEDGATQGNSVPLRPERFILRRITWATNADSPPYQEFNGGGSANANVVEITWGDEFTRFMGEQPGLLGAVFGQANGFLDLPSPILFQGRQSLRASLRRLQWPSLTTEPATTRFDIVFHGDGLLPANSGGFSGSV